MHPDALQAARDEALVESNGVGRLELAIGNTIQVDLALRGFLHDHVHLQAAHAA
ncbi:MAG: hypothetical protein IPO99_07265 [Nitrospira sp.]|nr:hypothetical protein [Nitrospira sp.]